jgi:hypothetical protein
MIVLVDTTPTQHMAAMEQHTLKNINSCWTTKITSYVETSGGQISNLYRYVVHFFQHQCSVDIYASLRQFFSTIGVYYMLFYNIKVFNLKEGLHMRVKQSDFAVRCNGKQSTVNKSLDGSMYPS